MWIYFLFFSSPLFIHLILGIEKTNLFQLLKRTKSSVCEPFDGHVWTNPENLTTDAFWKVFIGSYLMELQIDAYSSPPPQKSIHIIVGRRCCCIKTDTISASMCLLKIPCKTCVIENSTQHLREIPHRIFHTNKIMYRSVFRMRCAASKRTF